MLSTGKLIAGIAAVGVTGGAGVGSFILLNKSKQEPKKSKISTLLGDKNLISTKNKARATQAWTNYKKDAGKQSGNNPWKLSDWSAQSSQTNVPDSLVTLCNERKEDEVDGKSDSAYINFINWCTLEAVDA